MGLCVLTVIVLCCPSHAAAACTGASPNWTAASPSAVDVQACLNVTLHCGDTINVPAGSATWTTQVIGTLPTGCGSYQGLTLKGQTVCDGTAGVQVSTCTDKTIITTAVSNSASLKFSSLTTTSFLTLTGFTFVNNAAMSSLSAVALRGIHGTYGFRVHHIHAINSCGIVFFEYDGYGLNDHILWDSTQGCGAATPINFGGDFASAGYLNWQDPTNFGSREAYYVEDSRENSNTPSTAEGFFDGYYGAKVVIRYSTINGDQLGGGHGTDSGPYRSVLLFEIYNNTVTNNSPVVSQLMNTRGGTVLFFNNTVTGSTPFTSLKLQYYRISQPIGAEAGSWGVAGPGLNWTPVSTDPTSSQGRNNTLNGHAWIANHAYDLGAYVTIPGAGNYQTTSSCTSGQSAPSWSSAVVGSSIG